MDPQSNITFPGQAISPNPSFETRLLSGASWLVPSGNWVTRLGAQCAAQWYDVNFGLWRTFESGPSCSPVYINSDGVNYRVINLSGTITGANITTAGTAYTQANTTISFAAPVAGTPAITATGTPIIGGSLTFAVTTAGTGYVNPMVIVPSPIGLGGTAGLCIPALDLVTTVTAGALVTLTAGYAGAGYVTAPGANTQTITPAQFSANPNYYLTLGTIILIDSAGTGGVITATIANGTSTSGGLTGIVMTNNGAGYDGTHIPAVTVTSATGASAAATALPCMACSSITVGSTNTGYTASVELQSTLTSGTALSAVFGDPVVPRNIKAIAAQSGGILGTPTIEDAGIGFQTVPLVKQVGNATADGSVNATFTAVVGGVSNTVIAWQIG